MQRRVGETLLTERRSAMCGRVLQVVQEGELVPPRVLKLLEARNTFGTVSAVSRELLLATSVRRSQMSITARAMQARTAQLVNLEVSTDGRTANGLCSVAAFGLLPIPAA